MKSEKSIPSSIKSLLWSYDIKGIDTERDKEIIIIQILNYGTWDEVKWLFKTYDDNKIRKVISHPGRGRWWSKVLNFWLNVFDIEISLIDFKKAIIKM